VVTDSGTLKPNEGRAFDVETPSDTTQINVSISWIAGLAVWQVHPDCPIETVDQCPILAGPGPLQAPPAVSQPPTTVGMTFVPQGPRARIIVKNTLSDVSLNFSVTIEPHRAGCT
jgi:hypothetical protein